MNGTLLHELAHYGMAPESRSGIVRVSFIKSNYFPPLAARSIERSNWFDGIFERCDLACQDLHG